MNIAHIHSDTSWDEFHNDHKVQATLVSGLRDYVQAVRWFGGKAYELKELRCDHCLPMDNGGSRFYFLVIEAVYTDHDAEYYLLPLALSSVENSYAVALWQG